jgi:hypothetical protein
MKTNPSTVYRWVVAAMDRITAEPAKRALELELRRLDQLQTAIYADALQGDLSSQQMYLRIADQRARLLGACIPRNRRCISIIRPLASRMKY